MKQYCLLAVAFFVAATGTLLAADAARPNILFITVDDMSCDSVGAFGCKLPGTTPHIDQLAREGLKFEYAHVQVGNCMPSRNVMLSGRYPHNNRVEGFYQVRNPGYPVLADLMKEAGYFTAIRGKVSHSTPYSPFAWDLVLDQAHEGVHIKNIASYGRSTEVGIAASREAGKPFCMIINVSDPHKPFYGVAGNGRPFDDPNVPSRVFTAEEVPVPGFLPDDPLIREELAHYYSSVRRADDCVGAILKALDDSGLADQTVVMFLSDHGMPLPFAKTAVYHHSTRTPWIVRFPGVTRADSVDRHHMISAVDLTPTLLDIAGIKHPGGFDGRSFLPLIHGKVQDDREMIFKEYNENSGGARHPMRSVQTKRFGYIFNPWADGQRVFRTATTGTMTYRRMKELAETDPNVAARLELFNHRVVEEFYDYQNDPDALHNLIDDPRYQPDIARLRQHLEDWMLKTGDHALEAFRGRNARATMDSYMERVEKESAQRRGSRRQNSPRRTQQPKQQLIQFELPFEIDQGKTLTFKISHNLPPALKTQLLHVTLKEGDNGVRIERKVLEITGAGETSVSFTLPDTLEQRTVSVAAFIGTEFSKNLQHIVSKPIPAR